MTSPPGLVEIELAEKNNQEKPHSTHTPHTPTQNEILVMNLVLDPDWETCIHVGEIPHSMSIFTATSRSLPIRQQLKFQIWSPDAGPWETPFKYYDFKEILAVHTGARNRSVFPVKMSGGCPKLASIEKNKFVEPDSILPIDKNAWRIYLYVASRNANKRHRWGVKRLQIDFPDMETCQKWALELSRRIRETKKPRRLLIYINPFGGKGKAKTIYEKKVKPVFILAGIETEVVLTNAANHAHDEILKRTDLDSFDGIVSVGGDGLYNEVLCGAVERTQIEAGVEINSIDVSLKRPKFRIGIIPAGSTNALCHTIHGTGCPTTAALHIAMGDKSGIDTCGVYCSTGLIRFASTGVSYGYLGEVLKTSETMRCLGPVRYKVSGMKAMIKHPRYAGRVDFSPKFTEATPDMSSMNDAFRTRGRMKPCRTFCEICYVAKRTLSAKSTESHVSQMAPDGLPMYTNHITDEFTHVVGVITPCICDLSPEGLSPWSHLGDGTMDLGLTGRISRFENMQFLADAMIERPFLHMFRVSRFAFTPMSLVEPDFTSSETELASSGGLQIGGPIGDQQRIVAEGKRRKSYGTDGEGRPGNETVGVWNIDGEILEQPVEDTLHFRVHRQLITVFARGIESEEIQLPKSSKPVEGKKPTKYGRKKCCCISAPPSDAVD